jgi:hypothetical protein
MLVGTSASATCRPEDADYEGHSLSMLRRIGAALSWIERNPVRLVVDEKTKRLSLVREISAEPPCKRLTGCARIW